MSPQCSRVRHAGKLPFSRAPRDDRGLPDMHLALYDDVVVFDHATKLAYVIAWVHVDDHASVEQVTAMSLCCFGHAVRPARTVSKK